MQTFVIITREEVFLMLRKSGDNSAGEQEVRGGLSTWAETPRNLVLTRRKTSFVHGGQLVPRRGGNKGRLGGKAQLK